MPDPTAGVADIDVTDIDVMAIAAAEMATVTIEPEKRSPMTISFCRFTP